MKAVRSCCWLVCVTFVAVTALVVTTPSVSWAQSLTDPAVTVLITDGADPDYSQSVTFSGLDSFTSGGGNYNGNVFLATDWGADVSVNLSFTSVGHHLSLGVAADAGSYDTTFSILSTAQAIGPFTGGAVLSLDGSLGAFDINGITDGLLTGGFGDGSSLKGYYGPTATPSATFASLITTFSNTDLYDVAGTGNTGLVFVPGTIASMQLQWNFTVAAGDSASGTSDFEPSPVPEPSSLGLLALGSLPILVLGRRFRKGSS